MNKRIEGPVRSAILACILAVAIGAIGASACQAQDAPRVELSAEAAGKASKVVASLEDFSATPVELTQLKGYSKTLTPAVQFLRTYYELGRSARRDELLKLYAPALQAELRGQFTDDRSVAKNFADLDKVIVDSAVTWGNYRVVLVKHAIKSQPGQTFPWVHVVDCTVRCMFVKEQELVQTASYLLYLIQFGKQNAIPGAGANSVLQLALPAVFSEAALAQPSMSDPVELRLVDADPAAKVAGAALLAKLVKFPDAGTALAAAEKALFDGPTPTSYPRKSGYGQTIDHFSWSAYIEGVRKKTWSVAYTFKVSASAAILVATTPENDLLLLPFHQVGKEWRMYSSPGKAALFPLFESRPFAVTMGQLLKKRR